MREQLPNNKEVALPKHRYPLWINLFTIGAIVAVIYSCTLLPKYLVAAKQLNRATQAYKNKSYDDSIETYKNILKTVPSSRVACIGAAEALFAKKDKSYDEIAMDLLAEIKLGKREWKRITKVMPAEYQKYFTGDKK